MIQQVRPGDQCNPNGCQPTRPRGIPMPGATPVALDPASADAIAQALLLNPPAFTQAVPRQGPQYNSLDWRRYGIFVVAPPTQGALAAATTGAAALATAESAARFQTVTVLTPAGPTTSIVSLFSEQRPDGQGLRVVKLGLRVHSSQRALRFFLKKNSGGVGDATGSNTSALELSDYGDLADPMDIFVEVQPTEQLNLVAQNLDVNSGYLVEYVMWGYTYPTNRTGPGDTPGQSINRQIGPGGFVR